MFSINLPAVYLKITKNIRSFLPGAEAHEQAEQEIWEKNRQTVDHHP
jgi:hypothetical protein